MGSQTFTHPISGRVVTVGTELPEGYTAEPFESHSADALAVRRADGLLVNVARTMPHAIHVAELDAASPIRAIKLPARA